MIGSPPSGMPAGWGAGSWGSTPWGGASFGALDVVSALAIAENVVRVQFTGPVYYSGILDPPDASDPRKYIITPVPGTVGIDGTNSRPVSVASVAQVPSDQLPPGSAIGAYLDLTLDRPMTPYSAEYIVQVSEVFSADLGTLVTPPGTARFFGVFKQILQPTLATPTHNRDFSNPQSILGTQGLANPLNVAQLGIIPIKDGDYAIDQGLVAYKKRLYRRCVTSPGGFVHLGNGYGIGIPQQGKKLALASTQQGIASEAESQIAQEPETQQVKANMTQVPDRPGLFRLVILAKLKGGTLVKFNAPFSSQ